MQQFPFTAVVGADDLALALILTTIAPEVGGVLVRGEKGTAKSTMARALADVLPADAVVTGCRFNCDPADPAPQCPDGPHVDPETQWRRPRLVELPVGATEDRVTGSLDLHKALGQGQATFEPGLLAAAHRGILYVDEVNLLHDHLVDLLLDAAAMGRATVERDGISVSHPARMVLIGTMNPEEGELRPQLLDRFGLTVEIAASRDPDLRAEVVQRRLAHDADPLAFAAAWDGPQRALAERLAGARERLAHVRLDGRALRTIARVCAGFDVDGMRADIVTARAARAHAAWESRETVTKKDIRAAARLALPHRRRRNPFDAPGLDEALLDRLLDDQDPDPPEDPEPQDPHDPPQQPDAPEQTGTPPPPASPPPSRDREAAPEKEPTAQQQQADSPNDDVTPVEVAGISAPYRARLFKAKGTGSGASGRRSPAWTSRGTVAGVQRLEPGGRLHLPGTIRAAATAQGARGRRHHEPLRLVPDDLRGARTLGQESNLVLFVVDASGSMAGRQRTREVKTAVLSLLVDAYQRRDRVSLVTFRGQEATVPLPPTGSVETAARCLADLPHGGRTPLASGLRKAAQVVLRERIRDPHRRPLVVLITDGRATQAHESGRSAVQEAHDVAAAWPELGIDTVVIDCETGRFRMGLAIELAHGMGAELIPLEDVAADAIVDVVKRRTQPDTTEGAA